MQEPSGCDEEKLEIITKRALRKKLMNIQTQKTNFLRSVTKPGN